MIYVLLSHFLFFTMAFVVSKYFNKICIIDLFWPLGLMLPLLYLIIFFKVSFNFYQCLGAFLVMLWGLRLFFYLFLRSKGKPDDPRYLAMKNRNQWDWKDLYFKIFIGQGIFSILIAVPFYFWIESIDVNVILFKVAFTLSLVGLWLEAFADYSLGEFKKEIKNKGKLCMVPPWNFSRHPNYLGELMFWWGVWLMSVSFNSSAIWSVVSPLLLTYLIFFVTGIGPKEKSLEKYPEFIEYKKRVRKIL